MKILLSYACPTETVVRAGFRSENDEFRGKIVSKLCGLSLDKPKSFEAILTEIQHLQ